MDMFHSEMSFLMMCCIEAASIGETWTRKKRTLGKLPEPIPTIFFHYLLHNSLIYPPRLEFFQDCISTLYLNHQTCQARVDSTWLSYLSSFSILQTLVLDGCMGVTSTSLNHLSGLKSLKALHLNKCSKVNDSAIPHLLSMASLEDLQVSETSISSHGSSQFCHLKCLTSLHLGGLKVTNFDLSSLQPLTGLRDLQLWGADITDHSTEVLAQFPHLQTLNLSWTVVTSLPPIPGLLSLSLSLCKIGFLPRYEQLSELVLRGSKLRNMQGLDEWFCVENLRVLDLANCNLLHFKFLRKARRLQELDLSGTRVCDLSMDDLAQGGESLQKLNLSHTKVTSEGLQCLVGRVPNLRALDLEGTAVDGTVFETIALFQELSSLVLKDTEVTTPVPLSFGHLQELPKLETLDLRGVDLGHLQCRQVGGIKSLRVLKLSGKSIDDECLLALTRTDALKELEEFHLNNAVACRVAYFRRIMRRKLRLLDIRGCLKLSEKAFDMFEEFPWVRVLHEHLEEGFGSNQSACFFWDDPLWAKMVTVTEDNRTNKMKYTISTRCIKKHKSKRVDNPFEVYTDERFRYSRQELLAVKEKLGNVVVPDYVRLGPLHHS